MARDAEIQFTVKMEGTEEDSNRFRADCAKRYLKISTIKHGLGLVMRSIVVSSTCRNATEFSNILLFVRRLGRKHKVDLRREKVITFPEVFPVLDFNDYMELNIKVRAKCAGDLNYNADVWYISQNADDAELEGEQLFVLSRKMKHVSLAEFQKQMEIDLAGFVENIVPGQSTIPTLVTFDSGSYTNTYVFPNE